MKKSLFAIAAVTAFAGAAQAQSSVSVYGLIDIGYVGGNQSASAAGRTNNLNFNQFGASAQSTSRLGFRGTEDLGKGMSAFFNLETAITPNNGTFSDLQTRAANIGLAQKGLGRATIGTQNTVITDALGPVNTGQLNNIVGSMLFASRTGPTLGGTQSLQQNNPDGNTDAFTFRTGNTIKLQTERVKGFQGSVMAVLNDSTQTQVNVAAPNQGFTGGKSNNNGWGLGASYQYKKFQLTAAYMSLKATNPFTATAAQAANGTGSIGAPRPFTVGGQSAANGINGFSGGTNVTDNQAFVGAMYDFGIVKAYAGWVDRKVTSQINGSAFAQRTAQEIGIRGNWTPKIESWASVGNGRITAFGANEPTANINGWQLGSNYILSKRTNLYAIYGMNGTSGVSNAATGANQSFKASSYALGMRHTF